MISSNSLATRSASIVSCLPRTARHLLPFSRAVPSSIGPFGIRCVYSSDNSKALPTFLRPRSFGIHPSVGYRFTSLCQPTAEAGIVQTSQPR